MGLHNIFGRLCSHDIGEDIVVRGCQLLSWALANYGADKEYIPIFLGRFGRWSLVNFSWGLSKLRRSGRGAG